MKLQKHTIGQRTTGGCLCCKQLKTEGVWYHTSSVFLISKPYPSYGYERVWPDFFLRYAIKYGLFLFAPSAAEYHHKNKSHSGYT